MVERGPAPFLEQDVGAGRAPDAETQPRASAEKAAPARLKGERGPLPLVAGVDIALDEPEEALAPDLAELEAKDAALADAVESAAATSPPAIQVQPSTLHFGGYQVGSEHKLHIRVTNTGHERCRIRVKGTTSAEFETRYKTRGLVAPGMTETITVVFKPDQWRYYYDSLRVSSSHDSNADIIVPVHGYPVINKARFPRLIDFGVCAIGVTHTRYAALECKVPMPFDYDISEVAPSSEFKVSPLRGTIPANGMVKVRIDFTPRQFTVATYSIRLHVSQFNFEPIVCTVNGSAFPGVARNAIVARDEKKLMDEIAHEDAPYDEGVVAAMRSIRFDSYAKPHLRPRRGGGTGAVFDPGAQVLKPGGGEPCSGKRPNVGGNQTAELEAVDQHRERCDTPSEEDGRVESEPGAAAKRSPTKRKRKVCQKPPAPSSVGDAIDDDMVMIDGFKVPRRLEGVQAANFVLTQSPGKLKPKDLKKAIDQHRAEKQRNRIAKEKAEQKFLAEGGGPMFDPVAAIIASEQAATDKSTTRQVKEMMYLQQMHDIEEEERAREFSSQAVCLGVVPLTEDQIAAVLEARRQAKEALELSERRVQRQNFAHQALGPHSTPAVRVQVLASPCVPEATPSAPPQPAPTFDTFCNDTWRKRKLALSRLINFVGKLIIRYRAKKRIAAIWKRLGTARTRRAVRDLVEEDFAQSKLAIGKADALPQATPEEPSWRQYKSMIMQKEVNQQRGLTTEQKVAKLAIAPSTEPEDAPPSDDPNAISREASAASRGSTRTAVDPNTIEHGSDLLELDDEDRWDSSKINQQAVARSMLQSPDDLHLVSFPLYNDSTVIEAKPVPTQPLKGFQDLGFFRLREAKEFKLCGYERFRYPKVPEYVPRFDKRALRSGAEQESVWRSAPASHAQRLDDHTIPSCWLTPKTLPGFELVLPNRAVRAFAWAGETAEMDPEHDLRPAKFEFVPQPTLSNQESWEVGTSGTRAIAVEPTLADRWRSPSAPLRVDARRVWECSSIFQHKLLGGPREEDLLSEDEGSDLEVAEDDEGQPDDGTGVVEHGSAAGSLPASSASSRRRAKLSLEAAAVFFASGEDEQVAPDGDDSASGEMVMSRHPLFYANHEEHDACLAQEVRGQRAQRLEALNSLLMQYRDAIQDPRLRFGDAALVDRDNAIE